MNDAAFWQRVQEHLDRRADPLADPDVATALAADPDRAVALATLLDGLDAIAAEGHSVRNGSGWRRVAAAAAAVLLVAIAAGIAFGAFDAFRMFGGAAPTAPDDAIPDHTVAERDAAPDPGADRDSKPSRSRILAWSVRVVAEHDGLQRIHQIVGQGAGAATAEVSGYHRAAPRTERPPPGRPGILGWEMSASIATTARAEQ